MLTENSKESLKIPLVRRKRKNKQPTKLVYLQETRYITNEDVKNNKVWKDLKSGYSYIKKDKTAKWVDKAIQTVLNSIVFQQRVFFCMTRMNTRVLLKEDQNWGNLALDNNKYGFLLEEMKDDGLITIDKSEKPWMMEVIEPEILTMINLNLKEEQRNQVLGIRKKNHQDSEPDRKPDRKPDQDPDLEDRIKNNEDFKIETDSFIKKEAYNIPLEKKTNNDLTKPLDKDMAKPTVKRMSLARLFSQQNYKPKSLPGFDEIDILAELAVENCFELEVDEGDDLSVPEFTLKKILNKHVGKPSAKQKPFIEQLIANFNISAETYYYNKPENKVSLVEPEIIVNVPTKEEIDRDQKKTLHAVMLPHISETISILREEIQTSNNEAKKKRLSAELNFLEIKYEITN